MIKYAYAINNDLSAPIVGLPLTCLCGRLHEELHPTERFLVGNEIRCDMCLRVKWDEEQQVYRTEVHTLDEIHKFREAKSAALAAKAVDTEPTEREGH